VNSNAWLKGFQPILNRMTSDNSDGSCMSCCSYTHRVIQKQKDREKVEENGDEEGIEVNEDDL